MEHIHRQVARCGLVLALFSLLLLNGCSFFASPRAEPEAPERVWTITVHMSQPEDSFSLPAAGQARSVCARVRHAQCR